ncbi:lambda exonuclease family protein [Ketogulonicigenium vulgare]|uniref:lambda exonuclease family protein n=1 Tax=Ketogulonicigenium vulgare TaxID=92945 RepID=UPI0023587062|nr:lambda exonuclease family protein [Ketogulonicigenium vulgare]
MDQRSSEWFSARIGKVTASRVAEMMARTKSGYSTSRANYMAELICERLTGERQEGYTNAAMQWGTDVEPQARIAYEFMTDTTVAEMGFALHPTIEHFGASPDGLIGDDGLIEIKCPNTATHLDTLLNEAVPAKYVTQMQVQMACTGREWCDFVSFDPRLPAELQMWVQRVHRDADYIAEIEAETIGFLNELAKKVEALKAKYMSVAA